VYLHSDVLRGISEGMFPPKRPSAYVTALWRFCYISSACNNPSEPGQVKIKWFY